MSRVSYVNGEYCDHNISSIHIEDRGFQFADGVYEVFGVINSQVVDYQGHLNRLYKSLNEIKLKSPIHRSAYYYHVKRLIQVGFVKLQGG